MAIVPTLALTAVVIATIHSASRRTIVHMPGKNALPVRSMFRVLVPFAFQDPYINRGQELCILYRCSFCAFASHD
ncbi:hypothetical protein J6590_038677 [Homalodisca vitripennis]|nr:hypothetical protein J6590_038677 [Homalodisca vitripennis]